MPEHKDHNVERVTSKTSGLDYFVCHDCEKTLGRATEVYSRVVGYLRPVKQWNKGKQEEFGMRKEHKLKDKKKEE